MRIFTYKAKNQQGQTLSGLVEAPDQRTALKLLREKQVFIVHLSPKSETITLELIKHKLKKVSFNEIVNITRQLASLLTAGLSLTESIAIIRSQTDNQRTASMLLDIEQHLIGGGNLANALERHSHVFSKVYIALIRSGEASGTLDRVLTRLAETLEKEREFRSKVKSAMIYPLIIIIGMIVVVFIMMTVVIPKLTDMYNDFGIQLPFATRLLVSVSNLFRRWWWLMILATIGGAYGVKQWKKTPIGERIIDAAILRIPVWGQLQKSVILAEFARTFGMLISSGIHILEGLSFLKNSLGNALYRDALSEISKKIEKGFSIGETFAQYDKLFPVIVSQMIKVGEETGKLDETLEKLSTYFEKESEYMVKNLTTIIEPIIMVVLGLGVGFIVFSIITPIYSLTTQIQ